LYSIKIPFLKFVTPVYDDVKSERVDSIIRGGNTANFCAIDLLKASDKANHHVLYLKLMKRFITILQFRGFIPNELLTLLECWLSSCYSCIKWDNAWSEPFHLNFGVRPSSVSSPYLFALYLDDLTTTCLSVPGVCVNCKLPNFIQTEPLTAKL